MLRRRKTSNPLVPGGLIACTERGHFLVKGTKRFKFVSARAQQSWKVKVVQTSEEAMKSIPVSGVVGFRDGTLIRDISNHKIYLISEHKKRQVLSPDVLVNLDFKDKDILLVSSKETAIHQDGEPLYA